MCITSEDSRSQEEDLTWDILCDECHIKAVKLLKAIRLFDIHIEDYQFCPECTAKIYDALGDFYETQFGDEIP